MEKNLHTTKPGYSENILPVPWPFIKSRFHSISSCMVSFLFTNHVFPLKFSFECEDSSCWLSVVGFCLGCRRYPPCRWSYILILGLEGQLFLLFHRVTNFHWQLMLLNFDLKKCLCSCYLTSVYGFVLAWCFISWWRRKWHFTILCGIKNTFPYCRVQ